jgi:hypothetical protein
MLACSFILKTAATTKPPKTYVPPKHEAKKNTAGGREPSWRACHANQHRSSASLIEEKPQGAGADGERELTKIRTL